MTGYTGNIEEETLHNNYFRRVLYTGKYLQLVVMALQGGEEIGNEVHSDVDQFFRVEEGAARFSLHNGQEEHVIHEDEIMVVPAGTWHNVINTSPHSAMRLYTIYTPPQHPDGTVHQDKAEADAAEAAEHH